MKIKYYLQHEETGRIISKIYTLEEIEYGLLKRWLDSLPCWTIIVRCQSTGLKDKAGREIYKGDILKGYSYPYLSDGEHNYSAIVVWFDDSLAFGLLTVKNKNAKVRGISSGNSCYIEDFDSSKWEIIGSTHETPELLE